MTNKNRQARGENISSAKLTEKEVLELRELFKTKSLKELLPLFNIKKTAMHSILHRKTWKHI